MTDAKSNEEQWMVYAINLAKKAWGNTHPNPMVGSVLVDDDNQIISEGYHKKAGDLHAERMALTDIELTGRQKTHATLYVTLEPCCTHGKTPPCTEIILEKGIQRVVVGAIDPNPAHCHKGILKLQAQGVSVKTGVLERQCKALNPIFHHRMQTNNSLIAVKTATTLDGKIATAFGNSKWITGPQTRAHVMHWRKYFPSIAVGAGTVLADNPSLTIRDGAKTLGCARRLIFDRSLRTESKVSDLKVFNDTWKDRTVLITGETVTTARTRPYTQRGVQIVRLPFGASKFPLEEFRQTCNTLGIDGVYIEGGSSVISSFLEVKGVDYLFCYRAPKLFGSREAPSFADGLSVEFPEQAPILSEPNHEIIGDDILTHGPLIYP